MDVSEDQTRDYPPRLYPEGASNLENKELNHTFHKGDLPRIREALGTDAWEDLKKYPVGIIARLVDSESVWSGKTVHYLLCRQLRVVKKEIWSLVVDQPIRFGLHEFGAITGLNTDPVPTEMFEADQYRDFWDELKVPYGVGPKLDEIRTGLEKCRSWSLQKRKWLGLLLLLAMGIYALHHNSRIPFESAKRVFDDEAMMTYPWGRSAYQVLVDSIKTLSPSGKSYTINGLKEALLTWAYESVTCFGERFGRLTNKDEIPLLRWGGTRTRASFDTVFSEEIREHGEVRFQTEI